jgi:hypothetical protein
VLTFDVYMVKILSYTFHIFISKYNVYGMYRHWKEHVNIFVSNIPVNHVTVTKKSHCHVWILILFLILQEFKFMLKAIQG